MTVCIRPRLPGVVRDAGYQPDEPLVVVLAESEATPLVWAQGVTAAGGAVTGSTLIYAASLSKQVTAACAALLVRRSELDMSSTLSRWLPELPVWATEVQLRHLVHHTAALPPDADIDAAIATTGSNRTTDGVIEALANTSALLGRPGDSHRYSNAGYVCLALVVQRAARQPLAVFARDELFAPLDMADTCFWTGPGTSPPGAAPLTPPVPAPLSVGDGGLWSTASDLVRWSAALNTDRFGITQALQTPGYLNDGTALDYAWGMAVRSYAGHPVYRHGGGWTGLRLLHARIPDLGISIIFAALADDTERRVELVERLLDLCAPTAS